MQNVKDRHAVLTDVAWKRLIEGTIIELQEAVNKLTSAKTDVDQNKKEPKSK